MLPTLDDITCPVAGRLVSASVPYPPKYLPAIRICHARSRKMLVEF